VGQDAGVNGLQSNPSTWRLLTYSSAGTAGLLHPVWGMCLNCHFVRSERGQVEKNKVKSL
jgi:hypothetical protein